MRSGLYGHRRQWGPRGASSGSDSLVLMTYRQAGDQPSPSQACGLPRQVTGGLGDLEVGESWATLQPSSCGNLQTRRRLKLRPRSHSMLTRT